MRNVKKLAIPVVIVLVLLIAGISVASYLSSEIDLAEYIEIEGVSGLNGQGELSYRLSKSALSDVLLGDEINEEITEENFEVVMSKNMAKYDEVDRAMDCITITADKESGLSNGDTVTVTATFNNAKNQKFSFHFKEGSQTYTVSGLAEGKNVNPFSEDAVSISFSGISGQGVANLEILSHEEPISFFSYELTPAHNLSNGDIVTLKAAVSEITLEENGYFIPEITEMTYTVSGLAEYYDFSNGFPSEELSVLCEKALAACKAEEEDDAKDGYIILNPSKVHKAYSIQVSDPNEFQHDYGHFVDMKNAVCVISSYFYEATGFFPYTREVWIVGVYSNFYVSPDGTIAYDETEAFDMSMLGENIEEIEAWLYEEYDQMTFTELSIG